MSLEPRLGSARRCALLATAAVLAIAGAGCGSEPGTDALPAVELTALDGTTTARADDITGPAVINLWATWCGPCRAELPAFEAVHLRLADRVRFVGVNQGDEGGPAASFLDEVGVSFEQYLDLDGAFSDELSITGLPATVFVAADGSTELHAGALDEGELLELVDTYLGITP